MGCASGNCWDKFAFRIKPDYRPPQGGWQLKELPASIEERLRWAWRKRSGRSANNNGFQAIDEAVAFLRQNGVAVTPALKLLMGQQADEQWCAAEPSRCRGSSISQPEEPPATAEVVAAKPVSMAWASEFWKSMNRMLASDSDTPTERLVRWTQSALDLVESEAGCITCAEHWRSLLERFPPTLAKTNDAARVWAWRAHNYSREGKPPTALQDVVQGWNWPAITGERARDLLIEMGMDKL